MYKFASRFNPGFVSVLSVTKRSSLRLAHELGFIAGYSFERLNNLLDSMAAKRLGLQQVNEMDSLPSRVICTDFPDDGGYPYFREYNVNHFVTDRFVTSDYLRDGTLYYIGAHDKTPEITSQLMTRLMSINGVVSVVLEPYEVTVRIGKAYDWSYVEPQVINMFNDTFSWSNQLPVIERKIKRYNMKRSNVD